MEKFDMYFNTFKNIVRDKFSHLSSSDNNNGGMLTPSYFALDNLKAKY